MTKKPKDCKEFENLIKHALKQVRELKASLDGLVEFADDCGHKHAVRLNSEALAADVVVECDKHNLKSKKSLVISEGTVNILIDESTTALQWGMISTMAMDLVDLVDFLDKKLETL